MNKQKIHLDYLFTWVVKWCRMVGPLAQLCWQYTGLFPFVSAAIVCTHLISHKQNWEKGCGEGGIRRENAKALDLFLWDGSVTLHVILWKALCLSCVKFKLILHYIQIMYFISDSVLRIQLEKPTLLWSSMKTSSFFSYSGFRVHRNSEPSINWFSPCLV